MHILCTSIICNKGPFNVNELCIQKPLKAQNIRSCSAIWAKENLTVLEDLCIIFSVLLFLSLVFSLSVQPDVHWRGSYWPLKESLTFTKETVVKTPICSIVPGLFFKVHPQVSIYTHPLFMRCVSELVKWLIPSILSLLSPTERWVRIRVKSGWIINHPAPKKKQKNKRG